MYTHHRWRGHFNIWQPKLRNVEQSKGHFGASIDRVIPIAFFARFPKRFDTRYTAIIIYAAIVYLFAFLGGYKQLAVFSSEGILLIYLSLALSVLRIRKMHVSDKGVFKMRGGYAVPIISAVIIIFFLSGLTSGERNGIMIIIASLTLLFFGGDILAEGRIMKNGSLTSSESLVCC